MRVLVTGAAGFIGSSVADRLLVRGDAVIGLDNFDPYYDPAQKRRNVQRARESSAYELVEGDVCDEALVARTFERVRPEVVVHLAARAGVRRSVEEPLSYVLVNEVGGLNVLEACRRQGGVPVVFASTSSVYGRSADTPFRESAPAVMPVSPYAASKRSAELMVHTYHHLHQQPAAILRFFTVYGPRGRPDMALHKFTRALLAGQEIRIHGETTERDFTYIDDIVDGVMGAIGWVHAGRSCDTFNLGRSEPVRVRHLVELLAAELGVTPRMITGVLEPGESLVTAADVSKAGAAFAYEPKIGLAEGVRRWTRWALQSDEAPLELRRA